MLRRVLVGVAMVAAAGVFGWLVMSALGRILRTPAAASADVAAEAPAVAPPTASEPAAGPRIKATLFFGAEDGHRLVGVQQDVPLAEGTVAQARALVTALLTTPPAPPLAAPSPKARRCAASTCRTSRRCSWISMRRSASSTRAAPRRSC